MSGTGNQGKLYRNSGTNDTPIWAEVKRVIDLSTPLTKGEADVSRRESNWKLLKGTLKEGSIEFGYRVKRGANGADAEYAAFLDSFAAGTAVQYAAMDGDITEDGARGFKAYCECFDCSRDEPLTDGMVANIVLKPTDYEDSGTLVEPELVEISVP
ncbi:hypothetical protein C5Y96_05680 [Blastopirellula marina]|uniref:Phage tail protein n=1 Tax=Blastopirellula marina TaxID=124 RepID=A0A2S8G5B9_9BACT|nr:MULTISPECIES: hypothetical protein [Pirellulaceae]PQO39344.1 hypothetical protein C5Y96_05680 [Blastopirellula marina]RCS55652.1 hypothetical protein DTL36_05690 [Bremerella cremea]